MANQEIWSMISKYYFNIDVKLHSDLICVICSKILQNASQNNCGCRYCYRCIEQYLNGEDKCCPRQIDDCMEQIINLQRDITIDHVANKKILTIQVKCPETFCQFTDALKNMVEHIKSHEIKCPYFELGCNQPRIDIHSIKDHLNEENYSHTNLLIDSIQNLNNEINFLKENATKNQTMIEELRVENTNLKGEIITMKNEEMESIKAEMKTLKDQIKIFQKDSQQKQKLIDELLEKNANKERMLERRLVEVEKIQKKSTNEILALRLELNKKSIEMNEIIIDKFSNSLEFCELNQIYAPFEWKIENFMKIIDDSKHGIIKYIYSQPFYSHPNGYKLRLYIDPNGYPINEYTHLVVYFFIIKGEYDDKLSWPMRHKVTIALIDQISGSIYTFESFKFDSIDKKFKNMFNKPLNRSQNDGIESVLINLNVLLSNAKLIKNGTIFLKCFVE